MFKSMDTDNSGTITYEELKAGLPKLGTKLSESEVKQLMEAVISLISFIFCLSITAPLIIYPHSCKITVNVWMAIIILLKPYPFINKY